MANPLDVIKSRTIIKNRYSHDGTPKADQGYIGMVRDIIKREGPRAFTKGFDALALRLGVQNCVMFVVLE